MMAVMAGDLIVTFDPASDGTGKLAVTATANGFSGRSAAWFDSTRLTEFASNLGEYPLPKEHPVMIASGFGGSPEQLEQEHVRVAVYPVGNRGQVGVGVHLATERWPDTRPDAVCDVRLELLTTYQRLAEFSTDLVRVVHGEQREARLGEEVLA
jgi:hypothetical protein